MSNFNDGCYSCTAGTELLAKIIAGKCQMHYTRAAVGCGMIPEGKTPQTMTEPAEFVMNASISNVSAPVDSQCQVTVQLNSKNVETGFLATCILLYAQDPDIGEVPYTYLVLENNPEWIKSADSDMAKLAVFDLITAVGSIENVSADIAPDAVVTRSELDRVEERFNEQKKITLTGGFQGSSIYTSLSDLKIMGSLKRCFLADSRSNWNIQPWHRFASCRVHMPYDWCVNFLVCGISGTRRPLGILSARVSINKSEIDYPNPAFRPEPEITHCSLSWDLANADVIPQNYVMVFEKVEFGFDVVFYCKATSSDEIFNFTVLSEYSDLDYVNDCKVFNSRNSGYPDIPSGSKTVVSSLATIQNPTSSNS